MNYFRIFLTVALFLILFSLSFADIPNMINFQGILDSAGNPLANKTKSVEFKIYAVPAGGTVFWSETQSVTTNAGGVFNVILGTSNPIPDTVFDDTVRYLGINVGTDGEMSPRQQIVSNAYGYRVSTVDGATGGTIFGNTSIQSDLTVSGNVELPPSTATVGVIKSGANRFIHNFGIDNFFAGVNAGNFTLSGVFGGNTGVGSNALQALTTGFGNTANGYQALYSNTTGNYNTANGQQALNFNTTGTNNTANGYSALRLNTTGFSNTANGQQALFSNTTGSDNTANGVSALGSNTTGSFNAANGDRALYSNTTGINNTANGLAALYSNTTGINNTANGRQALYSNTTGTNNTAIGFSADVSAGNLTNATAIGANAVVSASNAIVLGGTGVDTVNVGIGTTNPQYKLHVVGENIRVEQNGLPRFSLNSSGAALDKKKWQNYASTTHLLFTALNDAENAETFWLLVERGAGTAITNVTFPNGSVGIGTSSPSQKLHVVGNICYTGSIAACSDLRYKTNLKTVSNALEKVLNLKGTYFNWKKDQYPDLNFEDDRQIGFVAQELKEILPEVVSQGTDGFYSVDYGKLTPLLVEAIKEQENTIQDLRSELKEIREQLYTLLTEKDNKLSKIDGEEE